MIYSFTLFFRYGVVWRLIALGVAGALIGLIAEIFVVQKKYSDNVGMCTSSTVSGCKSILKL